MSSPDLTNAERQAVMEVVNSPILSMGKKIIQFEDAFRQHCNRKHAIGVSSGTAGLHLCVHAAGIEAGDLVLTTPFSFVASTNALLYEGAIPIYVDVDESTGNLDIEMLRQAAADITAGGKSAARWLPRNITKGCGKLKAILSVDVFGQPADMDAIQQIANSYDLRLIDDACEALGAEYKGRQAGSFGDYGVFAFYPNKQITTGEGGMIVTDDDQAADLMRALRNQGRHTGDTWLSHTYLGYNYRLTEMSAAMGVEQMKRLEELLLKRERVASLYNQYLAEISGVQVPQLSPHTSRVSWFVYVIRLSPGIDRSHLAEKLEANGIPVRPYFLPIHLQPFMVKRFGYRVGDYPITEKLGNSGLALPFSGMMTEEQVRIVCNAIRNAI